MNRKKILLFTFGSLALFLLASIARGDEKNPQLIISAGKGGFLLTSPDGDFKFRIRGYVQSDGRFFFDQSTSSIDTFVMRRVRPIFEGTVYKYFEFKIMPDFGGGTTSLQDAYLDAKFTPGFKIRFGKAKTPFGLERLQSATDLIFIERSLATNLVPNRDLGIVVFGDIGGDKISYAAGILNGVVDLGSSDIDFGTDSKDFAGRIFVTPFAGFGVGVATTFGNQEGSLLSTGLPTYRTQGQLAWFRYRVGTTADTTTLADGTRFRLSPQLTYYRGPFGILAEYVSSSQEVVNGKNRADLRNKAWNFTTHFVLTGEAAGYKGVSPENPFDHDSGKLGAWEIAFRYSRLDIDEDAFPIFADPTTAASQAENIAGGLTWYFNKNVKFMFNYDHTTFEDANIETEKLFTMRFQIAW
ncbi:OprO/OprP family phosphate-selective porin [bacterium]|nr:OprO/OprP family phosphate-selective porin [bacterium]MCI0607278.1 OprO/OprP family phosphate-selective porin [bacterium]